MPGPPPSSFGGGYSSSGSGSGVNWGSIAASAISGYADSRAASAAANEAHQRNLRMTNAEYANERDIILFEDELAYYNAQKRKERKRNGLAEFRKFSKASTFPPGYKASYQPPGVPTKPEVGTAAVIPYKKPKGKYPIMTTGYLLEKIM